MRRRLLLVLVASFFYPGQVTMAVDATDAAIAKWTEAIRRNPRDAEAYYHRGKARLAKFKKEEAQADFSEAIRLNPTDARAFKARAETWRSPDKAVPDYTAALKLNPKDLEALFGRAQSRQADAIWKKGEEQKKLRLQVLTDYNEALRLEPDNREALLGRADILETLGEYDQAIADYTEAIRREPADADLYSIRANVWKSKGDYDRALQDLTECARLEPTSESRRSSLGDFWVEQRDYDKALKEFTTALELETSTKEYVYISLAECWCLKGEYAKAIADFERSLRESETVYANRDLALILSTCPDPKLRDGKRAIKLAMEACRTSGYETSDCIGALAAAFAEAGDFAKAVEVQQLAVNLFEDEKLPVRRRCVERLELYKQGKPLRQNLQREMMFPQEFK